MGLACHSREPGHAGCPYFLTMNTIEPMSVFFERSWISFPHDPLLATWIEHALPLARQAVSAPENAEWLRCGGTWFVGVNALPNTPDGAVPGGPKLAGLATDFVEKVLHMGHLNLDRAQISVCYPGYPRKSEGESDAAFRFRRDKDAAHLDGLLPEGPDRRRHLREYHGYVLGIPLVSSDAAAAPFVVWEGSHEIMRDAFAAMFEGIPAEDWGDLDVTTGYQAARKKVFETCRRVEFATKPGEAYLLHRLAIHGVGPWEETAQAGPDGRMIAYFRPENARKEEWLSAP